MGSCWRASHSQGTCSDKVTPASGRGPWVWQAWPQGPRQGDPCMWGPAASLRGFPEQGSQYWQCCHLGWVCPRCGHPAGCRTLTVSLVFGPCQLDACALVSRHDDQNCLKTLPKARWGQSHHRGESQQAQQDSLTSWTQADRAGCRPQAVRKSAHDQEGQEQGTGTTGAPSAGRPAELTGGRAAGLPEGRGLWAPGVGGRGQASRAAGPPSRG